MDKTMSRDAAIKRHSGNSRAAAMDWDPPLELGRMVLVDLPTAMSVRVLEVLKDAAPEVSVQRTDRSALRFSNTLPPGSLLLLPDPCGPQSAATYLMRLRERGISSPALILGLAGVPEIPVDERLEPVDAIALGDLDTFSFRRSIALFSNTTLKEHFLEEMASRLRAYERLLEVKDDERVRVLEVAGALERRLAEKEEALQVLERHNLEDALAASAERKDRPAEPPTKVEIPTLGFETFAHQAEAAEALDAGFADLATDDIESASIDAGFLLDDEEEIPSSQFIPPDDLIPQENDLQSRVAELERQLAVADQKRAAAETRLYDLRKHNLNRERELRRMRSQSASAGDLAQRLEASEVLRREQTREMLRYQQQIDELEERLETIVSLIASDPASEAMEPAEMLEHLGERLRRFESEHRAQQGTIDQLSHSLAVQQVDDTFDNAQSRRNVLQRVDEVVRRSLQSDAPLTAMMIAIENPEKVRKRHGSVLYDYMLVQVAQRLQLTLRRHDVLMRYGDEAFVLLTCADTAEGARPHAQRLQQAVGATPLELGSQRFDPSLRIAIVAYDSEMHGANDLLRRALRLLMDAKAEERGQIVVG